MKPDRHHGTREHLTSAEKLNADITGELMVFVERQLQ